MCINWEQKTDTIYIAFLKRFRTDIRDRQFTAIEAIRMKREVLGWRLDTCGNIAGVWLPFEAINDTHYPTLDDAKQAAIDYIKAIDLTPDGLTFMLEKSKRKSNQI